MKVNVTFSETDKSFGVQYESDNLSTDLDFEHIQLVRGEDGKSAYELAVEHGFEGSEEEWLESLQATDGKDGYTPIKGVDYFDGKDGINGLDGQDGYTPVKGIDYFDGKDGKDGYTPVKGIDYFDGQPGKNGADGYTPVKNKDYFDGKDGADGQPGYTPVRGTDYWTPADKAEIQAYVNEAILGGEW